MSWLIDTTMVVFLGPTSTVENANPRLEGFMCRHWWRGMLGRMSARWLILKDGEKVRELYVDCWLVGIFRATMEKREQGFLSECCSRFGCSLVSMEHRSSIDFSLWRIAEDEAGNSGFSFSLVRVYSKPDSLRQHMENISPFFIFWGKCGKTNSKSWQTVASWWVILLLPFPGWKQEETSKICFLYWENFQRISNQTKHANYKAMAMTEKQMFPDRDTDTVFVPREAAQWAAYRRLLNNLVSPEILAQ